MIAIQNKLFQEFTKVLNIVYLYKTGHMLTIFMPLDEEIKSRWFVGLREFMKLNVIYFTTINKKVLQLILLFLIGMEL